MTKQHSKPPRRDIVKSFHSAVDVVLQSSTVSGWASQIMTKIGFHTQAYFQQPCSELQGMWMITSS
eukprot:9874931-Karenia_brevis.AAC.1